MKSLEIIKTNYLRNFIILFLSLFLINILLSGTFLYLNIQKPLDTHYSAIHSIISELKDTLLVTSFKIITFFSFFMSIGLLLLGIIYTHRIAGPLYRIKAAAKAIGNGEIGTRIQLRSKDVIQPFADSINSMSEYYGNTIRVLSKEKDELKKNVTKLRALTVKDSEHAETLKKVMEKNIELGRIIKNIKL